MTVSSNNEKVMLSAVRTLRRRLRKALRATNCAMVMLALSAKTLSSRRTPLSWVKTFYAVRKRDALHGTEGSPRRREQLAMTEKPHPVRHLEEVGLTKN